VRVRSHPALRTVVASTDVPKHITDEQLGAALEAGWLVREIAIKLGCSDTTLYNRIRAQRQIHGPLWGASAPDCPPDPVDELRARLNRAAPSVEQTRHVALHAVHWGLETATPQAASVVKVALAVLESPTFSPRPSREDASDRRARLLADVVRMITGVDPRTLTEPEPPPEQVPTDECTIIDVASREA
jgi:hypothetical protein